MSKLYKELKYDTDYVMQPGDPITSFDGNTAIKAGNAAGKGFIETYGEPVAYSYEVTVDVPQMPGASCRVRIDDTCNTTMDITILAISGWPGATASGGAISVNGSTWGYFYASESWDDAPPGSVIPTKEDSNTYDTVIQCYHGDDSQFCTSWSNLVKTRQTTSKEISTTDQLPSLPLSVANGGTGVDGSSQSANKVLASPSSGTGAISFRTLVAADIPDLNTSKLTAGTLGVARGGTGKGSHTVNSVIIGGTSTTGALQNVAAASGAFYSTGANVKPQFGTLPVAQGGTGVNGSSQAINKVLASPASGSAGAISFRSLVAADIPNLSANKITSDTLDIARIPTGTGSNQVALGNHTHDAANISYDDNASYNTVAACLTDLVNTNLWVENNATNIMRGDETLSTLTLNGKPIATTGDLNILPITTSTATTLALNAGTYTYKVTDSGATGTFPTLTAPTGLPASCYYKFEMEWVTASPTATYSQTASTTPAMKWITSPVMQTDGLSHTYHISGRYDTTTSTFWMSCWKIDDAQGAITPDAHTLKYLLTTPTQTTSTTTNANDTITVQLSDHAINSVNVPVSVTNVVLKFPGQAVGKARDFFVRLIVTGSTVPSITLTEPDGSAIDFDVDDDSWTEIEQGVNLLMFTETAQ